MPKGVPYSYKVRTSDPCVSYAIGLQHVGDRLIVSYGAGDSQMRIWSTELGHFERTLLVQSAAPLIDDLRTWLQGRFGKSVSRRKVHEKRQYLA